MAKFSSKSAEKMLSVCNNIDMAASELDELPESEHLADIIESLTNIVAKLDAIINDTL